ncbi:MAG: nucleotidyltransferase domain-containing protein [Candidatus Bathyarchaeia archaeon]
MLDKSNAWRMLELFFKKPRYSFHLRELCRKLGWSPIKVRSVVSELKKQKLVSESREKNLVLFRSNRNSEEFKRYKRIYNILRAYEACEVIEKKIEPDAIILFGSALRGEDVEDSDFDICIVGAKERDIDFSGMEEAMNRKISLLFVEDMAELKKNRELLNNLINGFVLKGYLEVF